MIQHLFINYLLSMIMYEKETRTKANHFKPRTSDCIQYSYFPVVQQRQRSFRLSDDSDLYFRDLDGFHHHFFCNRKKI